MCQRKVEMQHNGEWGGKEERKKDKNNQLEGHKIANQNSMYQKDDYRFWRKCKFNISPLWSDLKIHFTYLLILNNGFLEALYI